MYTADPNATTYGFTDKSKHTANTPWKSDRKSIQGITDRTPTSDDPAKLLENHVIKRKCRDF